MYEFVRVAVKKLELQYLSYTACQTQGFSDDGFDVTSFYSNPNLLATHYGCGVYFAVSWSLGKVPDPNPKAAPTTKLKTLSVTPVWHRLASSRSHLRQGLLGFLTW